METETVTVSETLQVEGTHPITIADEDGNTTTVVAYTVQTTNVGPAGTSAVNSSGAGVGGTPKKKKTRKYSEDLYLKFGFIPSPTNPELPLCLLCERVFSNESMKTPRLREHITKIHPDKADNDLSFFKELKDQFYISKSMDEMLKESEKTSNVRTYRK